MTWINNGLHRLSDNIYAQAIYLIIILFVVAVTCLIYINYRLSLREEEEDQRLIDEYLNKLDLWG